MEVLYAERLVDESLSDDELLAIVALKDQDLDSAKRAFDIFFNKYSRLLVTLCYSICASWRIANSETIAEDIFQQTMVAIYQHPTYDSSKGKISTWMSKIAQRKAYDLLNLGNTKESYIEEIGPIEFLMMRRKTKLLHQKRKF